VNTTGGDQFDEVLGADKLKKPRSQIRLPDETFNSVPLHRGIRGREVNEPLGMHWSSEVGIPDNIFASVRHTTLRPGRREATTIIHGRVNKNAIIDINSRSGRKIAKEHEIQGPDSPEQELTVRPGATVQVTGLTRKVARGAEYTWDENKNATIKPGSIRKRKITYNPPRQVRA
jgi:hypothetical protein